MNKITEKTLDKAIDEAFKISPDFASWFLSKTKFSGENASYLWSRSNYPYGSVPSIIQNSATGVEEEIIKESETDILVVFEAEESKRFALHIENKLAHGKFTPLQPEHYAERAKLWLGDPKYYNYADYETVLIAPRVFYERWTEDAKKFDRYISHEEISAHLSIFRTSSAR